MASQNHVVYEKGGSHDCNEVKDSECRRAAVKIQNSMFFFNFANNLRTIFCNKKNNYTLLTTTEH